jgi:hypothetical protein
MVALTAQAHIGWLNMLCGYWSTKWQQEAYKQLYQVTPEETAKQKKKWQLQMTRWQKKILQTMWDCNKERHGRGKESQVSARREVLHKELEDIYNQKHQYPQMVTKIANWLDRYKGTFVITSSPD